MPLTPFLHPTRWIDSRDPNLLRLIDARDLRRLDPIDAARGAFELVRDEIAHSWDIRSHRVTRTATEALRHREGLCYSKSMLLAALLRALGIPAGLGYQRLAMGDTPEEGHGIHGLTTAFLAGRWIRLDARGNAPGLDAQFSLDDERLAFTVRPELGEIDFRDNLPDPHPAVVAALEAHDDLFILMQALPDWR